MENSPVRTLLITCAVVLLAAAGIYFYIQRAPGSPSSTASTTTQTLSDGTVITVPSGSTVSEVPAEQLPIAPNYRAPVAYSAGTSAEVKAAIEPRLAADIVLLDKNNQNFDAWMNVAILHKIGGDYRGAEAIWFYAVKVWPTSPVAFHNLADLYQNFLKDSVKAKFYFDQAAKLGAR